MGLFVFWMIFWLDTLALEIEPLVVPADSGTLKTPLVGWDFNEFWALSVVFLKSANLITDV